MKCCLLVLAALVVLGSAVQPHKQGHMRISIEGDSSDRHMTNVFAEPETELSPAMFETDIDELPDTDEDAEKKAEREAKDKAAALAELNDVMGLAATPAPVNPAKDACGGICTAGNTCLCATNAMDYHACTCVDNNVACPQCSGTCHCRSSSTCNCVLGEQPAMSPYKVPDGGGIWNFQT